MKSCKIPYLYLTSNHVYYFRFIIPVQYRKLFGQREIKRSLHTKERSIALHRMLKFIPVANEIMTTTNLDVEKLRVQVATLNLENGAEEAGEYIERFLLRFREILDDFSSSHNIDPLVVFVDQYFGQRYFLPIANEILNHYHDSNQNRLENELIGEIVAIFIAGFDDLRKTQNVAAFSRYMEASSRYFEEEYGVTIHTVNGGGGFKSKLLKRGDHVDEKSLNEALDRGRVSSIHFKGNSGLRFEDALDDFYKNHKHYTDADILSRNKNIFYDASKLFLELFGNIHLKEITGANIKEYVKVVNHLPSNRNKLKKFKGKDVRTQVALAQEGEIIGAHTVPNYLNLKACFEYWKDSGYIDSGFGSLFVNSRNKKGRVSRTTKGVRAFSVDELNALFGGYLFRLNGKGSTGKRCKDYLYWGMLVSLYSGCRANEVAQLRTDMVKQHKDGFWYFEILDAPDENLSTKNDSSERLVPIHPDLVKFGFIDFVNDQEGRVKRNNGKPVQLFRGIVFDKYHRTYTRSLSRNFAAYRKSVGVGLDNGLNSKNGSVDFHSFRRTFIRYFIQHVAPSEINLKRLKEIVGHKDEDMTTGVYAGRNELPALYRDMCLFDISRLCGDDEHAFGLGHVDWQSIKAEFKCA